MKIKRIGCSTNRVTRGHFYDVDVTGRIADNGGREMKPKLPSIGYQRNNYWELVSEIQLETKENVTMITIKKASLINGTDSDSLSIDGILTLIENEQANLDRLDGFKVTSKAITKLKSTHNANIKALVKIIDTRDAD